MKPIIRHIGILLSFVALSCTNETRKEDYFIVEGLQDSYEFLGELSSSEQFHINSSMAWKIETTDLDWLNISPMRQEGGHNTVVLSAREYVGVTPRVGTFSLVCGNQIRTVTVTQLGVAPSIILSSLSGVFNFNGGMEDGTEVLSLTANGDWSITSKPDWVSPSVSSGTSGTSTVGFVLDENQGEMPRSGLVVFTLAGKTFEYAILQNGKPSAYLIVDVSSIGLESDGSPKTEGADVIGISCNKDWTLTCDPWINASAVSGTGDSSVIISASENDTGEVREGRVTITTADGAAEAVVTVTQEGTAAGYVDLTRPLVWDVSTSEAMSEFSPEWKSGGIMRPATFNDLAYAKWIQTPANTNKQAFSYQSGYSGFQAKGGVWDDDGFLFHVPVAKLPEGKTLKFFFALRVSGTGGQYWRADISFDEGATWTMMDTGSTYKTSVLSADANVKLAAKGTVCSHEADWRISSGMMRCNVQIRLVCADGADQFNGVAPISTSVTAGLAKDTASGYDGPAIVIE